MTPDQIIQAIEPWIEIANDIMVVYWCIALFPTLAGIAAYIGIGKWFDGAKRGIDQGGFRGKRIADLTKIRPPRGPSGVQRPEDRSCEAGGQLRDSLPLRPWGPADKMWWP